MTNQNNTWTVYIHTCNVNQKSYVGITSKPPNIRWKNGEGYKTQVFYRAIQKYGWDNFTHKIIATNLTEQEAKQMEIMLIDKLKTLITQNGYNVSTGGEGFNGIKEKSLEAARIKNSKPVCQYTLDCELVGTYFNAEEAHQKTGINRKSINSCCNGNTKTAGGYIWVFYTNRQELLDNKEEIIDDIQTNKNKENLGKTVYQFDRQFNYIAKYPSIHDAAKAVNAKHNNISKVCRGELKSSHGYIWRFEDDIDDTSFSSINFNRQGKTVLQFDMNGNFIKEYKSCAEAAKENNLQRCGISKNCNHRTKYSGGYIWKFKDEANK